MKIFPVLFFVFFSGNICAQYCNMRKGAVFVYETIKKKDGLILMDSVFTEKVIYKGDSVFITKAWYGDSYLPSDIRAKANLDEYVYDSKSKLTDRIILDSEKENKEAYQYITSGYKNRSKEDIDKEWESYSKRIYAKGKVHIPIPDMILPHNPIPESKYAYKAMLYKFKASIKGQYLGTDVLNTEAGRLECAKLRIEIRRKALWMSSKDIMIEWYAKGIGLVKSETYSKRGKLRKVTVLKSIKTCDEQEK